MTYPKSPVSIFDINHLFIDEAHYERFTAYYRSKYLLTSFALRLARVEPRIRCMICDPGVAATNIARELGCIGKLYTQSFFQWIVPPSKGACTIAFASASDKVNEMESGVMLRDCKKKTVIDRILKVDEQEAIVEKLKSLFATSLSRELPSIPAGLASESSIQQIKQYLQNRTGCVAGVFFKSS